MFMLRCRKRKINKQTDECFEGDCIREKHGGGGERK